VRILNPNEILATIDAAGEQSDELKKAYHIYLDRPSSCYNGEIDFINDYKFLLPIQRLERFLKKDSQISIFRYLVDEANPWQPSSGAHHAVDLILLLGGFDLSFSRGLELSD
jgi:carboxylesterase type B